MPTFAADVLPDTTGRTLGSPSQRWNAYLQTMDVNGPATVQTYAPSRVIYVATTPVAANANSTGEQLLCGAPIPGGLLNSQGKVLRVSMNGIYTTQSGQTPQITWEVDLGALRFFLATTTPALLASMTNLAWHIDFTCVVYASGSSATLSSPSGVLTYMQNNTGLITTRLVDTGLASIGPVDLTVTEVLQTYCIFTTNTSPANICMQYQYLIELLN